MSANLPFTAKMDTDQFMLMAQAFREKGKTLTEVYELSETVHEAFCNQTKYEEFRDVQTGIL